MSNAALQGTSIGVGSAFLVFDVSQPASANPIGTFSSTWAWGFAVSKSGNTVYFTDFYDGLYILDISDRSNPRQLGGYFPGAQSFYNYPILSPDENYLWVGCGQNLGMAVFDVSTNNPPAPNFHTAGGKARQWLNLAYCESKNLLAIMDFTDEQGVFFFNATDYSNPVSIHHYNYNASQYESA